MAEVGHEHSISRRGFVAWAVGILGAIITTIIGLPAIGYLIAPALRKTQSDEWVPVSPVEDIPFDEPTLFAFARTRQVGWERSATSYGIYVIRKRDGKWDVFSNVCTHLSCRVSWKEEQGEFVCPCHDGRFAKDGAIISGPQPRPLDRFEYKVEGGTLMIHLVEG
jgi:menaquinol-cytochrome c reductase iron-sulfur subunit